MLAEAGVGRVPYLAGITATTFANPAVGVGYFTPSGQALGGWKSPSDGGLAAIEDALQRMRVGPPLKPTPIERPREAPQFMTEADARAYWGKVQSGWQNQDCRPAIYAALLLGWLVFRG